MEVASYPHLFQWLGIAFCITQSAMFSGLNLAFFSIPRLRLEVEATNKNKAAQIVLSLRQNSNFLLATILWGNVGINVLLTLLSNSVMAGVAAFIFSTILITFLGEIIPQAYFSRNALKMASRLAPVLRFYQYLLFPVTKPSELLLNWLVGHENIYFFKEKSLEEFIIRHVEDEGADEISFVEGMGAVNFLTLDDITVENEGELLHPDSIINIEHKAGSPLFPENYKEKDNDFLKKVNRSGEKWVVFTDYNGEPSMVLDADGFLRAALFGYENVSVSDYCHEPVIVRDSSARLGDILELWEIHPESINDDVIDKDIILLWNRNKQIITGADILGRLMRGITKQK